MGVIWVEGGGVAPESTKRLLGLALRFHGNEEVAEQDRHTKTTHYYPPHQLHMPYNHRPPRPRLVCVPHLLMSVSHTRTQLPHSQGEEEEGM